MSAPQAVKAQAERANQLMKPPAADPAPDAPAASDPPAPQPNDEVTRLKEENESLRLQLSKWQRDHKSLHGKYVAEIGPLNDRIKALEKDLEDARKASPVRIASIDFDPKELGLSDEEIEKYGPEFFKIVGRVSAALIEKRSPKAAPAPAPARQPDPPSKDDDELENRYFQHLESMVPNWRKQNDDAGFLKWLKGEDPATRRVRMEILQEAHGELKASLVAEIFRAYAEQREIGSSRKPTSTAPDSGLGGDPPDSRTKKQYRQSEVAKFYDDKKRGVWKGREKEARRVEEDILAASKEGRIVPG